MYEAFELLRRTAETRREGTRQPPDGIDPVGWEALLDRVEDRLELEEDRLEEGGRDGSGVSQLAESVALDTPLPVGTVPQG